MTSSNDSVHSKDTSSIEEVGGIRTAGDGDEFVIIGKQKFYKHELMNAFGGTLNPGLAPYPANKFANPAPLGLSALSLGISVPKVVAGLAAFYGGAVQFLAGVWELAVGNTFGGTALTSYGAFWLSFAAINVENFGIAAAYGDDVTQFHNAVGFYLIAWGIFTFMLWLCTIKSTLAFTSLFFLLFLTFILLGAGDLTGKLGVTRAGGVMGVITAFVGFYNAFAGVATKQNSYFVANPIPLARK